MFFELPSALDKSSAQTSGNQADIRWASEQARQSFLREVSSKELVLLSFAFGRSDPSIFSNVHCIYASCSSNRNIFREYHLARSPYTGCNQIWTSCLGTDIFWDAFDKTLFWVDPVSLICVLGHSKRAKKEGCSTSPWKMIESNLVARPRFCLGHSMVLLPSSPQAWVICNCWMLFHLTT